MGRRANGRAGASGAPRGGDPGAEAQRRLSDVATKAADVHSAARVILAKLEDQAADLGKLAAEYLDQGLLGQHSEALEMQAQALKKVEDTRRRLGMLTATTDQDTCPSLSSAAAETLSPALLAATDTNAQLLASSGVEQAWVSPLDMEQATGWHPKYRWRTSPASCCEEVLEVCGLFGSTAEFDLDVSAEFVRLVWCETGQVLRVPISFLAHVESCQAVRRRHQGSLTLTIPRDAGRPPQSPPLVHALRAAEGFGVVDGFMGGRDADNIRAHLLALWKAGFFSPGEVEGGDKKDIAGARTDQHMYTDAADPAVEPFTRRLDRLVLELVQAVPDLSGLRLMRGRPMAAMYLGAGSCYTPHFDAFHSDNGRVLTCILYLNPFWCDDDGAQLKLWPEARTLVRKGASHEVAPLHGRLVVFLCDGRNLHEVCPVAEAANGRTVEPRMAISCWYYNSDAVEDLEGSQRPLDAPELSQVTDKSYTRT